jgi:aryl-alcohol dehydrogenase
VPQVFAAALQVLGMRGVAGFVSAPPQPFATSLQTLLHGGRALRGIIGGDAAPQVAIPLLLDFWRQGRFPLEKLITQFDFEDIGAAFEAFHHASVIKPVLRMAAA